MCTVHFCIWLMLIFLFYMTNWDKCLLRQFWVLHSHTYCLYSHSCLSSSCYLGHLDKGGPCRHCTSSAIVVSLFWKRKRQSEGMLRKMRQKQLGHRQVKGKLFQVTKLSPSDPGPWLPLKCTSEGGWAVHHIPIHLLLFPGKTWNSGREEASVKSDTFIPLVVSACSNCSLQETLRAALIHKWEAVRAELWLGDNLFPFKTITSFQNW